MKGIDNRSLPERVYEYILDKIVMGVIKYGDNISIKQIAADLDVSTMPVREAVKRLEFEQVVYVKPRSSCCVRTPSPKMIKQAYELREVMELTALSMSLGHIGTEAIAELREIVEQMRSLQRAPDDGERERKASALDHEFHSSICALAGNDFLNTFYRQLSLHVNMTLIHEKTYRKLERHWPDVHAEILRCIEVDPSKATEVLRRHFLDVTEILEGAGTEEKVHAAQVS
jgi:DNA-binding GntR family transcriptional regulator